MCIKIEEEIYMLVIIIFWLSLGILFWGAFLRADKRRRKINLLKLLALIIITLIISALGGGF